MNKQDAAAWAAWSHRASFAQFDMFSPGSGGMPIAQICGDCGCSFVFVASLHKITTVPTTCEECRAKHPA